MKVSICIPTFNRPDLLKETLDSCLEQTYPPYEIVIGDDSRNEDTKKFIKSYIKTTDIKIRYTHHKPSLGQADNTNFIIQKAEGDKIMLMHDDDLLLPIALETLINVFNMNSSVKIAFGKPYVISEAGVIDYKKSIEVNDYFFKNSSYEGSVLDPTAAGIVQQFPNDGYMISGQIAKNTLWHTQTSFLELGNGCEYELGLRLGINGHKMYYVDEYLTKYRLSNDSMSSNSDSAYKAYLILANADINSKYKKFKNIILRRKAPQAIIQSLKLGDVKNSYKIFFSRYNMSFFLTPGFYKRFLLLLKYIILKGLVNKSDNSCT